LSVGDGWACMSMRMGRSLAIQFDQMLVVIVLLRGDLGCGGGGWVWSGCAYCWVLWERRTPLRGGAFLVLVFENCRVSASIYQHGQHVFSMVSMCQHVVLFCVVLCCVCQVVEGARWMPRRQKPMKDVGGCDMPRGAANRALIRGCPNGGTRHGSCRVTPV
jgi:hypothetical protein